MLLFIDDQILLQDSEDKLQHLFYNFDGIGKMYNMKISTKKTKIMALNGKFPVRTKITIDSTTLRQILQLAKK
jgi:hypothetical protein